VQKQHIHFTNASDGVSIAYSTMGQGPALLFVNGWVSHLELDMENSHMVRFLDGLSDGGRRRLIRFDMRGSGLSDRDAEDISVEARARDIEAVMDGLGVDKVALFAWSMNGPPAIVFAAEHPERVSHLILYATFAYQARMDHELLGRALVDLIRAEWRIGSRAIVEFEHPDADKEIADSINNYQRAAADGKVAAAMLEESLFRVDVRQYLPKLTMPTLVVHRRDDQAVPLACGRELASLLPHAHFVPLPGDVHPPFFGDTGAIIDAVNEFLGEGDVVTAAAEPSADGSVRTVLFTDMEGSTALTQRLGDAKARAVIREQERIVREALRSHRGAEVKTMGDGFMASFSSPTWALECAVAMQTAFEARNESAEEPIRVRVGVNAGEPVAEEDDLFGVAVIRAARIAAIAQGGEILVANVVRELAEGKDFLFADRGDVALRGFDDPVRLFELRWRREG
jgi:class 3 adenylate cyclase/pimeloyl-ACP methyl ester carboxylesterase